MICGPFRPLGGCLFTSRHATTIITKCTTLKGGQPIDCLKHRFEALGSLYIRCHKPKACSNAEILNALFVLEEGKVPSRVSELRSCKGDDARHSGQGEKQNEVDNNAGIGLDAIAVSMYNEV